MRLQRLPGVGGSVAIALDPKSGRLYLPDTTSNAAVVIETATNQAQSVEAGTSPQTIAFNSATGTAFVCNYASASLTIIDTNSNSTTTISVGSQPVAVAVNPVTNTAYVVNDIDNSVSVVDGTTKAVTATIPIIYSNFHGIAVNPITNKIYVTDSASDQITIIDGATNNSVNVGVHGYPTGVAVDSATNKVYIANTNDGSITVLDGDTNVATIVAALQGITNVEINPNTNKIYVESNSTTSSGNTLLILDGATNQTSTTPVTSTPNFNGGLALNRQTNRIYVAAAEGNNGDSGSIAVIDGTTAKIMDYISVPGGAGAIAVDQVSDRIYVTDAMSNNVTVIDGATNTPVTILAGTEPYSLIVNSVTGRVYITDSGSNNISVITPEQLQAVPLNVNISGVTDSQTISIKNIFQTQNSSPSFTAQIASSYTSISASGITVNPPPSAVYYQVDGGAFPWTKAMAPNSTGSNPVTFNLCLANIPVGLHTLYLFPSYGDESAGSGSGNGTASSVEIGNIQGLTFLVMPGGTSSINPSASCASIEPPPTPSVTATTTDISSSANPQVLGSSITFTATVSPATTGSASPSGTVAFFDGASKLGTATLASNLTATFTTSSLALGSHFIAASYSGDSNFSGSSTGVLVESIVPAPLITTATAISASANPQTVGSTITFAATVGSSTTSSTSPSGTVSFFDGATKLGTATLASNLTATFATSLLLLGSHSITATYSGNINFAASTSAVFVESIVPLTATADFTITANPTSLVLASGASGTVSITAGAQGGFQGMVNLSCVNLPSNVSCSFQSPALSLNNNSQTTILTLSVKPTTQAQNASGDMSRSQFGVLAALCLFPGCGVSMLLIVPSRRLRSRLERLVVFFVLSGSVFALGGCGSGVYAVLQSIVVSGSMSGGELTHQTTVSLAIKQ
jgi:YVTN family beta-propeller protein